MVAVAGGFDDAAGRRVDRPAAWRYRVRVGNRTLERGDRGCLRMADELVDHGVPVVARSASIQFSTGTSSTWGAAAASRSQAACGTKPASTATRRAPTDPMSSGQRSGRLP